MAGEERRSNGVPSLLWWDLWGAGPVGRGWPTWLHSASFCVCRWLGGLADSMFETLWEEPQEGFCSRSSAALQE